MSPEVGLVLFPRRTYAALAAAPVRLSPLAALRRPLLVAIVLGFSLAVASTGRATPALILSTTTMWSYIVVLQLAIALPLIAPRARRTVGVARGIDLFFAGHAPWSLLTLAAAAWAPTRMGLPFWPLLLAAIVPVALTPRIVAAFFAEVLRMDRAAAWRMTAVHQAATWTVLIGLSWVINAFSPRVLALLGRT